MPQDKQTKEILRKLWEGNYSDDCDGHHECQMDMQYLEEYITRLERRIEFFENDYYHALAIIFGDEKLIKRKEKTLKENYIILAAEREKRMNEYINRVEENRCQSL